MRVRVTVKYQDTFSLVHFASKLEVRHLDVEHILQFSPRHSPDRRLDVPALRLVHSEDKTAGLLQENDNVLAIFEWAVTDVAVGGGRRGRLEQAQQDSAQD